MRRDAARLIVVTVTSVGILCAGMAGMAGMVGPSDSVRLPASAGPDRPPVSPARAIVQKGDHFWKISVRHLEETTGSRMDRGEIGRYWRRVVDTNRNTIRSGDPDLIFPGEVVVLPAP